MQCVVSQAVCVCGVVYVVPSKGVSGSPCANIYSVSEKSTRPGLWPHQYNKTPQSLHLSNCTFDRHRHLPFHFRKASTQANQSKEDKEHHGHTQGAQLTSSGTPSRILLAPAPRLHRHTCCRLFWRQPDALLSPCRSVDVTTCFASLHTCFVPHVLFCIALCSSLLPFCLLC